MHGSDVKWVQERLNSHGASPKLKVDSEYGPKTRDAVRAFQKAHKLTVDGIVGKATWTALGKA
jgi:peptidoglycan hydrolase-like protein with peptidoglycan-binding domain